MARKLTKILSLLNIILAIVLFFAIGNSFSHDDIIAKLLKTTGIVSTLIRLTIYVIPGIHLITGLFGLAFSARSILLFIGYFDIVSSICTLAFLRGESQFMLTLSIISIIISIAYLICANFNRRSNNQQF